ncbi:MAG: type II secretion system protein GspL [Betaproteobacteria bacterium]
MSLILACPPAVLREPWTAWLIGGGLGRTGELRPSDVQRLDTEPSQWPAGQELIVVVPAAMLSWHKVSLPRLPKHRWPQALAGLLEDQLLAEPALLHMALAPGAQAGSETWVAVCDKAWLQQSLAMLEATGYRAQKVVPEFEPGPSALYLIGQPEQALLVQTDEQGVLVMPLAQPLREALHNWGATLTDNSAALWAEAALADAAQESLQRPVQLMSAAQRLWQAAQSEWNLAQFDLSSTAGSHWRQGALRAWRHAWQASVWRPLRWGLLGLLAVQGLGLTAWAWQESSQQKNRQEEVQAILRKTFPQVKLIIDPVAQMGREVQALALASGSPQADDLGVMLSALAEAGAPPIKQLDYAAGLLKLEAWPLPAAQVSTLTSSLALRGYLLQGQGQQWQMKVRTP